MGVIYKISGIYKIVSPSGRVYIGKSTNINKRWGSYKKLQNCQSQIRLYRSFLKYGVDAHVFEIIEECSEDNLNNREKFYIKHFDTFDSEIGLNLKGGGDGGSCAEETKIKIGIANTGKKRTKEQIEIISKSLTGRTFSHSEETKQKLRDANLGKKQSDETKLKKSKSMMGYKPSEETLIKLRAWPRKKGWKHTEETKKLLSSMRKGKQSHRKGKTGVYSKETIAKFSEARSGSKNPFFGKKHSLETILKRRETFRIKRESKAA